MGPQNLNKIFDNKHIIENSETLFVRTGYFNRELSPQRRNKVQNSILAAESKERSVEDVINDLNYESVKMDNEDRVIELLEELYDRMETENLLNTKVSSKMKIHILKALYKYVESQNEKLLLNIARVILGVSNVHIFCNDRYISFTPTVMNIEKNVTVKIIKTNSY